MSVKDSQNWNAAKRSVNYSAIKRSVNYSAVKNSVNRLVNVRLNQKTLDSPVERDPIPAKITPSKDIVVSGVGGSSCPSATYVSSDGLFTLELGDG